ncbi:MAG: MBL fold metallo-hydrolase, partial [Proteobacteria bacterium]|nr:MBL fold metallo-hydrolase [Pseudomonadota bacterium]
IAEEVQEPEFMKHSFSVREYYGTLNHNTKATYQKYYGYFDGNPASLNPHTPVEEAKRYVSAMGGADAVLETAWSAFEAGDYRWVSTILNHLVFAEPGNQTARDMLASTYEQLGFQAESVLWRNIYLCGAQELREGMKPRPGVGGVNEGIARAMPLRDFFNLLAVKLDPAKAKGVSLKINYAFSDTSENVCVTVNNQVENHRLNTKSDEADLSVSLARMTLNDIAYGRLSLDDAIKDGSVELDGAIDLFRSYLDMHVTFDLWFNVIEP